MYYFPRSYQLNNQEPTDTSKQPVTTRCLGHVTGYQPFRDQYFLIRSVPADNQNNSLRLTYPETTEPGFFPPNRTEPNLKNFLPYRTEPNRTEYSSDPDLPGPDLPEPRFTGRVNFPLNRKFPVFDPDIPGTPIYRAKSIPPSIPVNRGPTCHPTRLLKSAVFFGAQIIENLKNNAAQTRTKVKSNTKKMICDTRKKFMTPLGMRCNPLFCTAAPHRNAVDLSTARGTKSHQIYWACLELRGVNFPLNRKFPVFDPDIPGTPIYRAKSIPPSIPVNRGPTVSEFLQSTVYGKYGADMTGRQLAAEVMLCLVIQRGSLFSVLDWVRMARCESTKGVKININLLTQVVQQIDCTTTVLSHLAASVEVDLAVAATALMKHGPTIIV
eukprot:sb/3465628/